MDQTAQLAAFAAGLRLADVPSEVIERTKLLLIDTIAVTVAGTRSEGIRPLIDQVREWGGAEQASIVGESGPRCTAPDAAFVNAAMAHSLDFDDTHDEARLHANACVLPACMALAERQCASGSEFLLAHIVGLEIASRLALAAQPGIPSGWLPTTIFGGLGAAAAAGRLLNLDPPAVRHAMGIQYGHTGGNRQALIDRALIKRIQPGLYSKSAVISASLARRGITGAHHILDGTYGLYPMFVGPCDLGALTEGLASRYEMMNIGLKPYPTARNTHPLIEGALHLVEKNGIDPSQIHAVRLSLATEAERSLIARERAPDDNIQIYAQFSAQYTVACALLRRRVGISDLEPEAVLDPVVQALVQRITIEVSPTSEARVEVDLKDSRRFATNVAGLQGHASTFLPRESLRSKVIDCFTHAGLTEGDADEMFGRACDIDRFADISPFIASLGRKGGTHAEDAR